MSIDKVVNEGNIISKEDLLRWIYQGCFGYDTQRTYMFSYKNHLYLIEHHDKEFKVLMKLDYEDAYDKIIV